MDSYGKSPILVVHKTDDDMLCVTLNNRLLSEIPPTNKSWRPHITMSVEDEHRLAEQLVQALGENVFRKVLGLQPNANAAPTFHGFSSLAFPQLYNPVPLQVSEDDTLPRAVISGPKCMFV